MNKHMYGTIAVQSDNTGRSVDTEMPEDIIGKTFHLYGIEVSEIKAFKVGGMNRVLFKPPAGVRLSVIRGFRNELQMALSAETISIMTPVPGTNMCAVDFPSETVQAVELREILDSREWKNVLNKEPVPVCIGKDLAGKPVIFELDDTFSMMVGGGKGSDQEVQTLLKALTLSAAAAADPKHLNVVIADFSCLDLGALGALPHLHRPIITDSDEAWKTLEWAVREMRERFSELGKAKCRTLTAYNKKTETDPDKDELPQILIILNEADTLLFLEDNSRNTERLLMELLSHGGLVGINVVMGFSGYGCTCVPGIIRSNCRISAAFQTSDRDDSVALIGTGGAEDLTGRGDMLLKESGRGAPVKIQGISLSDEEVTDLVDRISGRIFDGSGTEC